MMSTVDSHGPHCMEAHIQGDRSGMCAQCRAEYIVDRYADAHAEGDTALMEAVVAASTCHEAVREDLNLLIDGLVSTALPPSVHHAVAGADLERRHRALVVAVRGRRSA